MIIEFASVGATPKPLESRLTAEEVPLDDEAKLIGSAIFRGETFREASKTHVRGNIRADVEVVCTRCVEPTELHLDIVFDDVFVDQSEEPREDELEIAEAALDESLVGEGSVDLSEIVREQIILALPDMVFCKEDCKGLCDKCGTNLNLLDCNCKDDEIDPRWAALKNLN
jgi:uncharacterized protein